MKKSKMLKLGLMTMATMSLLQAKDINSVKNNIIDSMKGPLKVSLGNNPYKNKLLSNMKIDFLGIKKFKDLNNVYIAFLKIKFMGNEKYLAVLAFKDGNIIVPLNTMNFFTKNGVYKNPELAKLINKVKVKAVAEQELKAKKASENFVKVFEAKKDSYVYLNSGKKLTKVMFLDPNCPFCVRKLRSGEISNLTNKYNLLIMLTPLVTLDKNNKVVKNESLHPPAMHVANLILQHSKNKNEKEKIQVLSKYMYVYNPYKPEFKFKNEKDNPEINKKLVYTIKKYINSGMVRGTPVTYTLDENLTKELNKKLNTK